MVYCRQKVTRTVDTGAGFFLEEEDEEETRSKKTEVKHPLGEVKVTAIEGQGCSFKQDRGQTSIRLGQGH